MNELQTAYSITSALDEASEALPYRVSERLARARRQALAEMPTENVAGFAAEPGPESGKSRKTRLSKLSKLSRPGKSRSDSPPLFARLALTVAPIVLVVAGFVSIAQLKNEQQVQEMAELDAAVIFDTVPIAAYADHGFGVFLKNNRQ